MNLQEVITQLANEITKDYKISYKEACSKLETQIETQPTIKTIIIQTPSIKHLNKNALFKKFYKTLKKQIYYELRQYINTAKVDLSDPIQVAQNHSSTKERLEDIKTFAENFYPIAQNATSILDLGGGAFPLIINLNQLPNLKKYTWIDKDTKIYEVLNKNNSTDIFEYIHSDLQQLDFTRNYQNYDLVLMFKLIAVLKRQSPKALNNLLQIKCQYILLSGNKFSLAKKQSIKAKETRILLEFITQIKGQIIKNFETANEIFYLIRLNNLSKSLPQNLM